MKKTLPLLITIFLFLSLFPLLTSPTQATDLISITAIPPRLELEVLPGSTLQETLKITNSSPTEQTYQATFTDFIVSDDQGTPIPISEGTSGRWSLASWLNIKPTRVTLKPQQTSAINLIITIPADALAGGHYAMVTYNPITQDLPSQPAAAGKTGSTIIQKVGTLIYLNVVGDVTEAAYLKQFKTDKNFKKYGPINLSAEIENLGDVHIRPQGTVTISNLLGKTTAVLNLEEKNIFPFASRKYELTLPGKWRLGRYQAKLEAFAGNSQVPLNGLIYFWIIPTREIAFVVLTIIILIILLEIKKKQTPPPTPKAPVSPETPETTPPSA